METLPELNTPTNRHGDFSSSSRNRSRSHSNSALRRPRSERDLTRNGAAVRSVQEHRSPASLPQAFQGMLKTTTETGDVGLFSIKPSRLPLSMSSPRRVISYNENGTRRLPHSFRPYGVPVVDDRRRLPSYSRDTTSELISMYESPSQKSSRVFDDSDFRSYSMTQTSSYTLSNHRSYTSLRSQAENNNGLLQRPRSPFAYPTRLRRPGFRPSSPALTDGGLVDYSRRAEIDRSTYGGHSTSSPASLYAQKRFPPPFPLRPEANRSTPSLLSQASPKRSSSPQVQSNSIIIGSEWPRKNGPTSINTSPARSTFSLASTVNFAPTNLLPSSATTPAKLSTPIYYDYTEDFDVEEYNPILREPPPHFQIERTIPEDRPVSTEQLELGDTHSRKASESLKNRIRGSSSAASIRQMLTDSPLDVNLGILNAEVPWPTRSSSLALNDNDQTASQEIKEKAVADRDKQVIRLSRLGYGAQQLNSHVQEAFGFTPSLSFDLLETKKSKFVEATEKVDQVSIDTQNGKILESKGVQPPSRGLGNPQLPHSTASPRFTNGVILQDKDTAAADALSPGKVSIRFSKKAAGRHKTSGREKRASSLDFAIPRTRWARSSGINSVDGGLSDLTALITTLGNANKTQKPETSSENVYERLGQNSILPPTAVDQLLLKRSSSGHSGTPLAPFNYTRNQLNQQQHPDSQISTSKRPLKQSHEHYGVQAPPVVTDLGARDMPNFSHQIPRRSVSRPESPMLAPKPISPARQLKLKNSVPQLMKALPPIPLDPSIRAVSPPGHMTSSVDELPCHFAPLLSESDETHIQEKLPPTANTNSATDLEGDDGHNSLTPNPAEKSKSLPPVPPEEAKLQGVASGNTLPRRLKLKSRGFAGIQSLSNPTSQPATSEGHTSTAEKLNGSLPLMVQDQKPLGSNPPRFKLRVTRASNSTQDTVRIHRASGETKSLTGLQLRNPKDLFSPSTGIDNIFRQVGRHLHSRRSSANSSHLVKEISSEGYDKWEPSNPRPSNLSANQRNPPDVGSFFSDDSSNAQGRRSLRKRISNLKARMIVPYSTKSAAQSYDDVTVRGRGRSDFPRPPLTRSLPNFHAGETDSEEEILRTPVARSHRATVKDKLSKWFKGARSAIAARVRSRTSTGRSDDERP